ncbi:N-acetyltransferase [Pseudoalteromonas citrea]|uniref:N-acetyltransferase n=1 Tax=Pseudoalteromonas citrea TaxID=43655 RepID=A0A5S3XKT7_9GAMM|nr:GNAT family N-acetyltransferase [Pseudoalteromonas citrea]TMP38318.1 N-acetyltransferase [Pseudoalteromonas citrea]TMP54754.1 N-acetyltransferase [Pseudoalteromonas citrea]
MTNHIKQLNSLSQYKMQLTDLLDLCIKSGASLGFKTDVDKQQLTTYWEEINTQLQNRMFLGYFINNTLVGCVHYTRCQKQNGLHRAEIEKLLVHPQYQRLGIASALMHSIEREATKQSIELLVLDTQTGDKSEYFYQKIKYTKSGEIPHFVSDNNGVFFGTSYYFKILLPTSQINKTPCDVASLIT